MKNKKREIIEMSLLVLFIGLFLGFMYWVKTSHPAKTTACGWEKEGDVSVWVCREYKQVFYELEDE